MREGGREVAAVPNDWTRTPGFDPNDAMFVVQNTIFDIVIADRNFNRNTAFPANFDDGCQTTKFDCPYFFPSTTRLVARPLLLATSLLITAVLATLRPLLSRTCISFNSNEVGAWLLSLRFVDPITSIVSPRTGVATVCLSTMLPWAW